MWWISSISHRQIIFNPWTVSKKEDWAIVFLLYAIMKSVTSDLFQRSHYGKEEQKQPKRILEQALSYYQNPIYSQLDRLLLSCVFSTCWLKESPPAFLSGSIGWLSLLDLQDGWRDLQIYWYKRTQSVNQWERGWQTVYSCWQKVRYWQYWYSLAHFFLLASLPTSHQFLILLSGNVYIPAVKSHCWIWFQTTLCWEHIEIKTHGDCSYFKAFLSSYVLKTAAKTFKL